MGETTADDRIIAHARQRARERYDGLLLSTDDVRSLQEQIRERKSLCLQKTDAAELHLVRFRQTSLVALYSCTQERLMTFYPPEAATNAGSGVRLLAKHVQSSKGTPLSPAGKTKHQSQRRSERKASAKNRFRRQLQQIEEEPDDGD